MSLDAGDTTDETTAAADPTDAPAGTGTTGGFDVFDEPSRWRARLADEVGLRGIELCQALGAGPAYPNALRSALTPMHLGTGDLVVDIGAGTGATSELVRRSTGAFVVAVEPSPGSLEACARLFPHLPVLAGRAEALPLATGTAAGAILNGVASLVDDLGPVVAEARRVLREGGALAITDLFLAGDGVRAIGPNTFRSIAAVRDVLERHGFDAVELGVGSTHPREDWAAPQAALDELTGEVFGAEPAYAAFVADQEHLSTVMDDGTLIGGCITAVRRRDRVD